MKKPRINDFDPNAPRPLASPLDGMPEILPAARPVAVDRPAELEVEAEQSVDPLADGAFDQSIGQSIDQTSKPFTPTSFGRVLEKPKGFYITEGLDRRIDHAVRYLKETHGIKKVDRSIVVTVLLENDDHWTAESLDRLVEPVIRQLTTRLTGK